MRDKLLFESKFADNEKELDIAEGDAYKSIKEAWVAAIYGTTFGAMFRTTSTAISRVVVETKSRKDEEGNQQFENECIECSKVQWESNQHKIYFQ